MEKDMKSILLLMIFSPIAYAMEFEAVESLFSVGETQVLESGEEVTHIYYDTSRSSSNKLKDRVLASKNSVIINENSHPSINTNMRINQFVSRSKENQLMYLEDQEVKEEEQEYYLKNISQEKTKVGYFRSSMKKRYKMGEISDSLRRQRLDDL